MNYFDFYNIPISFMPNKKALKRTFYANSKKYHPDFYTLETEEKQAEILELSTLNNEAYKTLSDFDQRMKYILDIKSVLAEEGKNKVPNDFLMEMMDINEELMELQFDFDEKKLQQVQTALKEQEQTQYQSIAAILENYNDENVSDRELLAIKNFYLKKRYLLRIKNNLSKFASP